jgi:hypothetical protein
VKRKTANLSDNGIRRECLKEALIALHLSCTPPFRARGRLVPYVSPRPCAEAAKASDADMHGECNGVTVQRCNGATTAGQQHRTAVPAPNLHCNGCQELRLSSRASLTGGSEADGAVAQTTGEDVDPFRCGLKTGHVLRSPACFETGGSSLWRTTLSVINWVCTWRCGWFAFS